VQPPLSPAVLDVLINAMNLEVHFFFQLLTMLLLLLIRMLQISQLHPLAPEFAQEDAAADVAHSSKMNQLIRAQDGAAAQNGGQQQQQPEQGDALPMDFCWTSVIWTLALQHKNLQVGQFLESNSIKALQLHNKSAPVAM
jgi:hypothetical protein